MCVGELSQKKIKCWLDIFVLNTTQTYIEQLKQRNGLVKMQCAILGHTDMEVIPVFNNFL